MRIQVSKTYKLFIGGQFPRSESGRADPLLNGKGELVANVARGSRKDLRAAVEAARKAQPGWGKASAYLRGQIVYRMAEMMESRSEQLVAELVAQGEKPKAASAEVAAATDLLVYYAGWSDKFSALASTVNPVSGPHFNFSRPEALGVVGMVAPEEMGLLGLVSLLAPAVVGGNAVVALGSTARPLSAMGLAEVLATSDLPPGVVNLLTGQRDELLPHWASHRDIDGLWVCGASEVERQAVQTAAADSLKRVEFLSDEAQRGGLKLILAGQEIKTTWHPVGM